MDDALTREFTLIHPIVRTKNAEAEGTAFIRERLLQHLREEPDFDLVLRVELAKRWEMVKAYFEYALDRAFAEALEKARA